MLYHLLYLQRLLARCSTCSRYITFRTAAASLTALAHRPGRRAAG